MESPQKRSLGHLALAVLSTNVAVLAMNFLTGIIIARTLGVEGRGRLSTLQLWPMLISNVLSGGFNAAIIHFSAKHLQDKPRYIGGITLVSMVIGTITMGVGMPIALYQLPLRPEDLRTMLLAFLTIPLGLFAELTSCMTTGMGRLDVSNRVRLIRVVCVLSILAFLFLTHNITLESVFWAAWLPSLIAIFINIRVIKEADMLHWGDAKGTLKAWIPFATAGFVSTVLQMGYQRGDQLLMTKYMDSAHLGLYSNAVMLSELLLQVPAAISTVIFTNTSLGGQSNEDKLRTCARLIRVGFVAVLACGIAGIFLLPHVLFRVYKPEFVGSAALFNLLLPGSLAMTIAAPLQVFYQGKSRPWAITGPQILAIIVVVIGLSLSLPSKNLNGIALTASAGYMAYCVGLLWHVRRDYGAAAIATLFPHRGMIRSGWNWALEFMRRRLAVVR